MRSTEKDVSSQYVFYCFGTVNAWFLFQYINKTYIFVGENVEICGKADASCFPSCLARVFHAS
jgi:hypothetical protein